MGREAQMTDSSILLLLHQILMDPVLLIQIFIDIHLTYIVEQIEIKIGNPALFKLFLKDLLHLRHIGQIIPRELCSQIELFAGIAA